MEILRSSTHSLIRNSFFVIFSLISFQTSFAKGDQTPQFVQPIICTLDQDCFIQSYVDVELSSIARDYRCGTNTYDGHDGIDFRVLSIDAASQGVPVLAASSGLVKGVRDGMDDAVINDANRPTIAGHECGNGVVIDHGGGWETQYCHMRKSSLSVKIGDRVIAGQPLGMVGYSGLAQFAHLHFAVRHNGVKIDPSTGHGMDGSCSISENGANSLWAQTFKSSVVYHTGQILQLGFSDKLPELTSLEYSSPPTPDPLSPTLIFYARFMNLRVGDRTHLTLEGPTGLMADSTSEPLSRNKAVYLSYAGNRKHQDAWPEGIYKGVASIQRGGSIVERQERTIKIDNISR